MKLQKYLSETGVTSRRKCEFLIKSSRVRVGNKVVTSPFFNVHENAEVFVDDILVEPQPKRYIAFYKPKGVISTMKAGRFGASILDYFQDTEERLYYAGRLDAASRGLMIITNDGGFANRVAHPSKQIEKVYDVSIHNKVDSEELLKVAQNGVTIDDVKYAPFKFRMLKKSRLYSIVRMTIYEGKNREIRKIFGYLRYEIIDLVRIQIGNIKVDSSKFGTLTEGEHRNLSEEEINFF